MPQNTNFPLKPQKRAKNDFLRENYSLRHLECFFEKMEESRPPLKLKNNGGLLSDIFL